MTFNYIIRKLYPRKAFAVVSLAVMAVFLCSGLLAALPKNTHAASTLPAGFSLQTLPTGVTGAYQLTDFARTGDGGYFASGKGGQLTWTSAAGASITIANFNVVSDQDLGFTGLALAPDYATSRTLYTVRAILVSGQTQMTLSAWTVTGGATPSGLTNERVILQLAATTNVHGMTTVLPAADGTLWVSIGDGADFVNPDTRALRALDINQGYGKLLRVQQDGRGVTSNPYYDSANPNSWKSRVYASGFRSPFRFSLDPASGAPVVADVGWNRWEEVNIVRPGTSYGWPCWEADEQTVQYKDMTQCNGVGNTRPLTSYAHGPMGTSVTGGVVYTGSAYPVQYRGSYFFGDYSSNRLYTLAYDAQGNLNRAPEANGFGSGLGGPVRLSAADNGDIMYADITTNTIKRLVYASGNRAPTPQATTATNPSTLTVNFDAGQSYDLDGDILTYAWDFGDGVTGTGVTTSHTYAAPGTAPLTARLTVTDPNGAASSLNINVVPANNTPQLTLNAPPAGTLYKVGDPVSLNATATDAEDGALTVQWQTNLLHCSGGYCHVHPGTNSSGPAYSTMFEDHGDDTSLQITATATDSRGVATQQTYAANPKLRTLTINSNVPTAISINGKPRQNAQITVDAAVSIIPPAMATDGVSTFDRWADGGAAERSLTMPDSNVTYTAVYITPIDRRYNTDPNLRAAVGTPTAVEQGDVSLRYRDYTNGRVYWTAASGVHEVHGAIKDNYLTQGAHVKFGEPITDEVVAPDGAGRYNHFAAEASSYWTAQTGAHMVYGRIREVWASLGWERGPNGYPKSDELATPNGRGRFNSFQNGGIYWTPQTDARSVLGAIYAKWGQFGYEAGILGFPTTNETVAPDGRGRYSQFETGAVYWTPQTGAHEVHGLIKTRWAALGWERSYLGYPTSDEFAIAGGRRSNFERGYIIWNAASGVVTDRRY